MLINPSHHATYGGAKASVANPVHPALSLACLAGEARRAGHHVEILDLSWREYDADLVAERVRSSRPDVVGITATTPLMNQLRDISVLVKDISPSIKVVGGGAHPSAMPVATMRESLLDAVFAGEADLSFPEYCTGGDFSAVRGIYWRDGDEIRYTGARPPIEDLDSLAMPAWDLYNIDDYRKVSRLLTRRPPVAMAEFSRGCVFTCDFCASKITMAQGYRKKSPERCAAEAEHLYRLGYREFLLADDIFTSDQKWAVAVCEAIERRNVDMAWSCLNGIRVESADDNLFRALRSAGCYRVSFGFESGSDAVLKQFGKGGRASIEQGKAAVRMARKAGIETSGFFLLGLSPDTEDTIRETIEFARELPLDMMKFGVAIAFPGTKMFHNYAQKGLVRTWNWDAYFVYTDEPLFMHENLDYDTIRRYMSMAYKRAILFNPKFIMRRLLRGFRTGEFFWDVYYAAKFFLMPATSKSEGTRYRARDRWPVYDFANAGIEAPVYPVVKKSTPVPPVG
ncbi:MAG: B12-binding domain-containing radical SAM protein [Actinomycetota bacterium]